MALAECRSNVMQMVALLPRRRRGQLLVLLACMLVGAGAELVSIGSVLPFLRVLLTPTLVLTDPRLAPLLRLLNLNTPASLVLPAAGLLVLAAITSAAVRIVLNWGTLKFIHGVGLDLDTQVYRQTLAQPYASFVVINSSQIISGFEKINNIVIYMLLPIMNGIAAGVIALTIIALLFVINPLIATVAGASIATVYIAITLASRKSLRAISESWGALAGERIKVVQEALGAFRDIALDRSQSLYQRRFDRVDGKFRALAIDVGLVAGTPRFVVEGAGIVLIALLAVWFSGQPGGVLRAVPALGALALGAQRLIPLLQVMFVAWTGYRSLVDTLSEVIALLKQAPPGAGPLPAAAAMRPFTSELEVVDLEFRYGSGAPALTDITLTIRRGERIGLIGPTGSGKSTLVDLLMGLLYPTSGAIFLDGSTLTPSNASLWHAQIAHVPQSIFLADTSIAANIAFSEENDAIDLTRVEEAARRADIHDYVAGLPDGYDTVVGERGIRLSGGQRQRIGIARALYKRADVLVFDEATSALDDATEASIMASIDKLDRELTMITVAHRLSTLSGCDRVYQLVDGRIARQGSYTDVVGNVVQA